MAYVNLMARYPRSKRPIEERGRVVTDADRQLSRQFGNDYFDGDRMHGSGGYHYHPRFWTDTVALMREHYALAGDASILDVGCGKGFMLKDFQVLMPQARLQGLDVSQYAIDNAQQEVQQLLQVGDARRLPFADGSFDLVTSINVAHNFELDECAQAILEVQRVSRKNAFIVVDAWRNDAEREALQKWVLTCVTAMHVDDWIAFFRRIGYAGDYDWTITETL
jgi:ubiquinone/menaquinone biosynthesis C-methylase UbiE